MSIMANVVEKRQLKTDLPSYVAPAVSLPATASLNAEHISPTPATVVSTTASESIIALVTRAGRLWHGVCQSPEYAPLP